MSLFTPTDAEDPDLSGEGPALQERELAVRELPARDLQARDLQAPPRPRPRRQSRSRPLPPRRRPAPWSQLRLSPAADLRLAWGGAALMVLTTLLVSLAAANTFKLLPETVQLGIPPWLAGPFGRTGLDLGWGGALATVSVMVMGYVCVARRAELIPARVLVAVILLAHLLLLLAPPLLSTDVFSYQAYARLGDVYGTNPYLHGPSAIQLDPLYPFVGADWVKTPTAYGPVFTILSYALAPLSIAGSALAYKTLAAAAGLLGVLMVWKAARLRGLEPRRAAALVGLNPLTVLYGVGGGHNDLIMLLPFTAALLLALQRRPRASGAAIMLSAGIKLTAGILLPFTLAAGRAGQLARAGRAGQLGPAGGAWQLGRARGGGSGRGAQGLRTGRLLDRRVVAGAAAGAVVIAAFSFAYFGLGTLNLAGTLSQNQAQHAVNSFAGLTSSVLGLRTAGKIVSALLTLCFLVSFIVLVRRVWQGRMDWIDGAAWATLVLLVCAASLMPWYIAWLLPLAALARDRRLFSGTLIITLLIFGTQISNYVPHA